MTQRLDKTRTRFEAQIRNSSQKDSRPKIKINTVARTKLGVYNHLSWSQSSFQHMSCCLLRAWGFPLEHEVFTHFQIQPTFPLGCLCLYTFSNSTYVSIGLSLSFYHFEVLTHVFALGYLFPSFRVFNLRFCTRLSSFYHI